MPKLKYTPAKGMHQLSGAGIDFTAEGGGYAYRRNIITLSNSAAGVTRTLLASESGSVIIANFDSNTGSRGITVTMPAIANTAGCEFTFVIGATGNGTNDFVVKTQANGTDFIGQARTVVDGAGGVVNHSKITYDISDASTKAHIAGSSFRCVSDGTDWYLIGGLSYGGEDAVGTGLELSATI